MSRAGPVSRADPVCRDLGTPVKLNKNQQSNQKSTTGPARLAEIAMPGSRLTGLKIFHVIAFTGPAKKKNCLRTNLLTCKSSIFSLNDKEVHKTM